MKKLLSIILIFIIAWSVILYTGRKFEEIRAENAPYLANKEQFIEVFDENQETFYNLVKPLIDLDKDIIFQYNSACDDSQFLTEIGDTEVADTVKELVVNAQMTNIIKYNDWITVYQYEPIVFSDIEIGVKYYISSGEWFYYYKHDYDNCRHKNKICYKLYDLLFNRKGRIMTKEEFEL